MGGTELGGTDLRIVNRIASFSGLVLIALGALGGLASLVSAYQGQDQIASRAISFSSESGGSPTFADRITVALQYGGGYVLFALLVIAAGIALVVTGLHLPDRRPEPVAPLGPGPTEPPVIEVPLEVEDRAWAPVSPRPDEDPLRP